MGIFKPRGNKAENPVIMSSLSMSVSMLQPKSDLCVQIDNQLFRIFIFSTGLVL